MWCSPPTWWCASPPERGAGGPPGRRRPAPPPMGCCGAHPGIRIRLRAQMSGARRRLPTGRTGCRRGRRAAAESGVRPAPSRLAEGHSGMDAARRSPPRHPGVRHTGESTCHPGVCHAGGRPGIRACATPGGRPAIRAAEVPGHRPGTRRPRRRGVVIGPASSSDPASLCARRRGRSRHLYAAAGGACRAARVLRRPRNCRMAVSPPCFRPRAPTGPRWPLAATRR